MKAATNRKKIFLVNEGQIPTVSILESILNTPIINLDVKTIHVSKLTPKIILSKNNIIIFCRVCSPIVLPLLNIMIEYNIPYIYYLDDNFWEFKGNNPIAIHLNNPAVRNTLNLIVSSAKYIIAASEELGRYIKQLHPNTKNIIFIKSPYPTRELIKRNQHSEGITHNNIIKICYVGSQHKDQDFECVTPAIKQLIKEYNNHIAFYFYGFLPKELQSIKNVYYEKNYYDYNTFINKGFYQQADIAIAPMADTPTQRCKTNNKYREYSAFSLAAIYSNIPPFSDSVIHNYDGLLVNNNSNDWYNALKLLIEDSELRNVLGRNAYLNVTSRYRIEDIAEEWKEIMDNINHINTIKFPIKYIIKFKVQKYYFFYATNVVRIKNNYKSQGALATGRKVFGGLVSLLSRG